MEKKNNRKILEYFTCENKEHWLCEIQKSDWGAGQYLYSLLKENKLKALVGATTLVLMLADGDKLVSFCTLAPLDDVQPTIIHAVGRVCVYIPGVPRAALCRSAFGLRGRHRGHHGTEVHLHFYQSHRAV